MSKSHKTNPAKLSPKRKVAPISADIPATDDHRVIAKRVAFDAVGQQMESARILCNHATAAFFEVTFGSATKPEKSAMEGDETDNTSRMEV